MSSPVSSIYLRRHPLRYSSCGDQSQSGTFSKDLVNEFGSTAASSSSRVQSMSATNTSLYCTNPAHHDGGPLTTRSVGIQCGDHESRFSSGGSRSTRNSLLSAGRSGSVGPSFSTSAAAAAATGVIAAAETKTPVAVTGDEMCTTTASDGAYASHRTMPCRVRESSAAIAVSETANQPVLRGSGVVVTGVVDNDSIQPELKEFMTRLNALDKTRAELREHTDTLMMMKRPILRFLPHINGRDKDNLMLAIQGTNEAFSLHDSAVPVCYLAKNRHMVASDEAFEVTQTIGNWIIVSHILFFITVYLLFWDDPRRH